PFAQLFFFRRQRLLRGPQLSDGRFHRRPSLVEAPPLFLEKLFVVVQFLAEFFRLLHARFQVGLARFLHGPLIAQGLFLAAQVLAHPLQPRPQRREHGLLPFQRRGPLVETGGDRFLFLLLFGQRFGFACQAVVPFVELRGLFFEVAGVALQLLEALV